MEPLSSTEPFAAVLSKELEQIQKRRGKVFGGVAGNALTPAEMRPFGVALSGGGIRSATFNLGILQGLAEKGLLKYVDYLSTVSGGGYIGAWLHGLIRNRFNGDPAAATKFLSPAANPVPGPPDQDAIAFLRKYSNYPAPKPTPFSPDIWVVVLIWMRNVLLNQLILVPALAAVTLLLLALGFLRQTPQSLDLAAKEELQILAFVLLVLLPLAGAAMIAGWNLRRIVKQTFEPPPQLEPGPQEAAEPENGSQGANGPEAPIAKGSPDRWSLAPVALVFLATLATGATRIDARWYAIFPYVVSLFLLFQVAGGFIRTYMLLRPGKQKWSKAAPLFHVAWMSPAAAAVSTGLILAIWSLMARITGPIAPWVQLAFAPTLICLGLFAGVSLLLGLMGSDYPDGAREWISRTGAMILITCAVWSGLFLVAIFGPWAFSLLLGKYGAPALTALGGWAATTVAGVLAGKSAAGPAPEGAPGKSRLEWLIGIAPPVFMIGYLLIIAMGVHLSLRHVTPAIKLEQARARVAEARAAAPQSEKPAGAESKAEGKPQPQPPADADKTQAAGAQAQDGRLTNFFKHFEIIAADYFEVLALAGPASAQWPAVAMGRPRGPLGWLLLFLVASLVVTSIASWRVNINEFSMHHMYKNRLVRCYLGASNSDKRKPNKLTGFDPADDFSLGDLLPECEKKPYFGPYAIVNTALNLNAGSELAQQERKAASFVFTPQYCGFAPAPSKEDDHRVQTSKGQFEIDGYRPTRGYSCPSGPNIGTAMAISGAAANPNSGYQTSGPMAFLLTVFDARLGWWVGNPRWKRPSKYPGPLFALKYLFAELLGQTTGRTKFVNLSDGGHFDNLGLYELVRRQCRYIIICDGEQDGDLTFGSLGGAIRKCRAAFGVEIDINPDPIRIVTKFSAAHCVVGTIEYPEGEPALYASAAGDEKPRRAQDDPRLRAAKPKTKGWLLYLKSSLTGDEPADVVEYRSRNDKFPHESTADQFFSESQFESYRRLGLHVVRDAFDGVPLKLENGNETELLNAFRSLTRKWYAPIPVSLTVAGDLADSYSALMRRLAETAKLAELIPEILPGDWKAIANGEGAAASGTTTAPKLTKEVLAFGLELIQLMENVYTEFGFEHAPNRANPRNAGWVEVFHHWAKSSLFYDQIWLPVSGDYQPLFRQFMKRLHDSERDDWPMRS